MFFMSRLNVIGSHVTRETGDRQRLEKPTTKERQIDWVRRIRTSGITNAHLHVSFSLDFVRIPNSEVLIVMGTDGHKFGT